MKSAERVAMTRLALDNDCNIYDANDEIVCSSPLFNIMEQESVHDSDSLHMRDVIQYLTSIGYDLEAPNKFGQTPLHFAASECSATTTMYMGFFIERGARLDTKDDFGMGLLHAVLLRYLYLMNLGNEPHPYDGYGALEFAYGYLHPRSVSWLPDGRDMYWEMNSLLRPDYVLCCRFEESVGGYIPSAFFTRMCE